METHRDVAHRLVRQLGALPTVDASLTRLTADRLRIAKIDPKPLLLRAGLTQEQISDPDKSYRRAKSGRVPERRCRGAR